MKVSFINQIADLCEKVDANIIEVSEIIGLDERIGDKFLRAGPGFGGSCFPKDTRALAAFANKIGVPQELVQAHHFGQRKPQICHGAAGSGHDRRSDRKDCRGSRSGVQARHRRHSRIAPPCRLLKSAAEKRRQSARFRSQGHGIGGTTLSGTSSGQTIPTRR